MHLDVSYPHILIQLSIQYFYYICNSNYQIINTILNTQYKIQLSIQYSYNLAIQFIIIYNQDDLYIK